MVLLMGAAAPEICFLADADDDEVLSRQPLRLIVLR
jgi:hypothetical protein